MVFDKSIIIEKFDEDSNEFKPWKHIHAYINKRSGKNYAESGSERTGLNLVFEVRYFRALAEIFGNFQNYRIIYNKKIFYISDYDDYMESHHTVKLTGDFHGGQGN